MTTRIPQDIRNIAVCGHGSSGKTTLVDQLLVKTGAVSGQPSVDSGTSICDFDEEEKHHKHSIESSVVHFDHGGKHFNLIDTPGYPDLIGQTIGALRAVDTALIAIDAHAGIKVNTRRAWQEAGDAGLGRILCITRLDAEQINFPQLVDSIREIFGNGCALFNVPLGQGHDLKGVVSTLDVPKGVVGALIDPASISESVLESIIEADEKVMEKYFEGEMPSKEELDRLAGEAVRQRTLTPIVCVSTKAGVGVDELLDVLVQCALPPTAIPRSATKTATRSRSRPTPLRRWPPRCSRRGSTPSCNG
jgi:elongation factor G